VDPGRPARRLPDRRTHRGLTAAGWAGHVRTAEASARTVQVHAVRAILLQKAPAPADPAGVAGAAGGGQVWVPARWNGARGPARTGEVLAPEGSPAGTVVTVWLNASGRVTSPPPEPGQAGNLAALAALAAVALTALAALRLTQRFLIWRRLAAWEAAWSAIGPR
jgi:hypothetical protein